MNDTNLLHLELLLQHALPLVQSAEPVDLLLIFAPYMGVVACGGFLFFGELDIVSGVQYWAFFLKTSSRLSYHAMV